MWAHFGDVYRALDNETEALAKPLMTRLEGRERNEKGEQGERKEGGDLDEGKGKGKKGKVEKEGKEGEEAGGESLAGELQGIHSALSGSARVAAAQVALRDRVRRLYDALPSNAMMIAFSGEGNTALVTSLLQIKRAVGATGPAGRTASWDDACDALLTKGMREASETEVFITIKE